MNSKKYWTVKGDHSCNDRPFYKNFHPFPHCFLEKKSR